MSKRQTINDYARESAHEAIDVAREIMSDTEQESKDRLRAAEMILDRGYGKAAQAVIAIPADRAARAAAALFTDAELDAVIEGEIVRREEEELLLPAPIDPLLE
jgi:hypothetical protein